MYLLIEYSPNNKTVISEHKNEIEAENKALELQNNYCDYYVVKITSHI